MDPMLEIARGFLRSERNASRNAPYSGNGTDVDFCYPDVFPEYLYAEIRSQIGLLTPELVEAFPPRASYPVHEVLWQSRDERAQEVLANVFYAKPEIARKVCEIRQELIPRFVHYLAEEARRHWQMEQSGNGPGLKKKKLQELFESYHYAIHETFPTAFELFLIEHPEFMEKLADHLESALPFSLMLKKELDEIESSRKERLQPDPDAAVARLMDDVLRIHSRLYRLKTCDDEGVIQREQERLEKQERKLWQTINSRNQPHTRMPDEQLGPSLLSEGLQQITETLFGLKEEDKTFSYPPIRAEEMSLFGLALSGGGMRSATFNLGVLQGLADLDLLRRLDYLSGVSGGSHIAAWLGAWIKREPEGIRRVQRWLSPRRSPTPDTDETHPIQFLRRFSNYLAPKKGVLSADTWSIVTIWLRNTILNQIVFILLLGSLLTAPKLILAFFDSGQASWFQNLNGAWFGVLTLAIAMGLSVLIGMNLRRFDPGAQDRAERRKALPLWTQFGVQMTVVLGTMVVALLGAALIFYNTPSPPDGAIIWLVPSLALVVTLWTMHLTSRAWRHFLPQRPGEVPTFGQKVKAIGAVLLISALAGLAGGGALYGARQLYQKSRVEQWHDSLLLSFQNQYQIAGLSPPSVVLPGQHPPVASIPLLAGLSVFPPPERALSGVVTLSAKPGGDPRVIRLSDLPQLVKKMREQPSSLKYVAQMVVFGPAVVIGILALVTLLQIGLMGRNLPDNRREWWGRLGAVVLITLGSWIVVSACAFWGPALAFWLVKPGTIPLTEVLAILWLLITGLGSQWGFSAQTAPLLMEKDSTNSGRLQRILSNAPRRWIALIAPYVYIAGLAIALSFLLYAVGCWNAQASVSVSSMYYKIITGNFSLGQILNDSDYWKPLLGQWWFLPVFFPAMLVLAVILAWRFDVNEFSMHSLYRNRLVRCYLGASRAQWRNPNPFTGFDADDDMRLSLLQVNPPVPKDLGRAARAYYGPYPIFNTALNLVAGKELAWQERKAASFVLTPRYCGYELVHGAAHEKPALAGFGYRPSTEYAEPDLLGPGLGTCMATSGAAANPNMGYHYSPALSFLMALFNVRLGCWMGNPRHRTTWKQASPTLGLGYLMNELIGGTNDTSRFVNLSDGGHFENLGIYELVRRHCMYIVVCDAEEDLPFSFRGLGDAIRKCRADFGVDIRLDPDQLRPVPTTGNEQGRSQTHCAIGDIVYSRETQGKLLYIKTSLTGDEPGDVLGYKLRHSSFPHQSTIDQFFDESQFESYRALGQHISMVILQRASDYVSLALEDEVETWMSSDDATRDRTGENKIFMRKLFESLQAIWYPPTAKIVALRERHRELYDQLIEMFHESDKQNKNNLEFAARTFFRTSGDLNGPLLAYSKMIELMHRVFQDLDLETTSDHPYNEGWMNIFRGWAGDDHFKEAWEIARENYDNRFRTFCYNEFNLDPGRQGEVRQRPAA